MVAASALSRHESRGGHFRSDFPELDPALDGVHTIISGDAAPSQETWAMTAPDLSRDDPGVAGRGHRRAVT